MLLRDRLLARIAEMGRTPDYQRLATEVLGIQNAPPELARRLVSQALVIEDRQERWQAIGDRVCAAAPQRPGVYILRDEQGRALYVGKANNVRRRLRTHFSRGRWKKLPADFARVVEAEWIEVGSELEAILREAALIAELRPVVNVQVGPPLLDGRAIPRTLVKDTLVILPSVQPESVKLVGVRADGGWMIQCTERDGSNLKVHSVRVWRFFHSPLPRGEGLPLAPLAFSWLAGAGLSATRLNPAMFRGVGELRRRLEFLLQDEDLFAGRIEQR